MIRVRHSTFGNTGTAVKQSTKTYLSGEIYPSVFVDWDRPTIIDNNIALYNLVFIVPAPSRKVCKND